MDERDFALNLQENLSDYLFKVITKVISSQQHRTPNVIK